MSHAAKHALIVGASRGLGLGLAETFLRRGWRVTATRRGLLARCIVNAVG